jgi:sulfur relay (sulfurtransferase) DsrC/TusE family protein
MKRGGRIAPGRTATKLPGPFRHLQQKIESAAERDGLWPLTGAHWKVIRFFLEYHEEHGRPPVPVRIGRATGFGARELHELFPEGVVQTICRLAGLELPADLWAVSRRHPLN